MNQLQRREKQRVFEDQRRQRLLLDKHGKTIVQVEKLLLQENMTDVDINILDLLRVKAYAERHKVETNQFGKVWTAVRMPTHPQQTEVDDASELLKIINNNKKQNCNKLIPARQPLNQSQHLNQFVQSTTSSNGSTFRSTSHKMTYPNAFFWCHEHWEQMRRYVLNRAPP